MCGMETFGITCDTETLWVMCDTETLGIMCETETLGVMCDTETLGVWVSFSPPHREGSLPRSLYKNAPTVELCTPHWLGAPDHRQRKHAVKGIRGQGLFRDTGR